MVTPFAKLALNRIAYETESIDVQTELAEVASLHVATIRRLEATSDIQGVVAKSTCPNSGQSA